MNEFIFTNNYIWPGVTAIIYKIPMEDLPKSDLTVMLKELGIKYKKTSNSEWESFQVYSTLDMFTNEEDISAEILTRKGFSLATDRTIGATFYNNCIYIVITLLDSNTSYDIKAYYISPYEEEVFFNLASIKTFLESPQDKFYYTLSFSEMSLQYIQDQGAYLELQNIENITNEYLEYTLNIINSMGVNHLECPYFDKQQNGTFFNFIYKLGGSNSEILNNTAEVSYNISAASDGTLMLDKFFRTTIDISAIAHEFGHNLMIKDNEITDTNLLVLYNRVITKFMEFATNVPKAAWKWAGSHNYPIISPYRETITYTYILTAGRFLLLLYDQELFTQGFFDIN